MGIRSYIYFRIAEIALELKIPELARYLQI